MRAARNKLLLALAFLALWPAVSRGQISARPRGRLQAPRLQGLTIIGERLTDQRYGLGSLHGSAMAPGGALLRSNLAGVMSNPNFNLVRASPGAAAPGLLSRSYGKAAGQQYGTPGLRLKALTNLMTPVDGEQPQLGELPAGGLEGYLRAMGRGSELKTRDDGPITSFVPTEPSLYQKHMKDGDQSFRRGRYSDAKGSYEIALTFSRRIPEVRLSLVHSMFALGRYRTAAFHLEQALILFPELPLVQMKVREFYGEDRAEDFDEHCKDLTGRLTDPRVDGELWLLMAYFLYFGGQQEQAVELLRRAHGAGRQEGDTAATEASETFWSGLAAAGKVTGSPSPATQPTTLPGKSASKPPRTSRPPAS